MALPPLHRVDHEPVVILSFDDAWDHEVLNDEVDAIKDPKRESPWPTTDDHPWLKYSQGASRGDLNTVSKYLRPDGAAVMFKLRRLSLREMAIVETREQTSVPASRLDALAMALIDVEGAELKFTRGGREPPARLVAADMEKLRELIGDQGIRELGAQAIACSQVRLQAAEKKP